MSYFCFKLRVVLIRGYENFVVVFFLRVDGPVFVELGPLLEGLPAVVALEGFPPRVGPEVVQHVAFFIKFLVTRRVSTKKNRIQPLGFLVHYLLSEVNLSVNLHFFYSVLKNMQLVYEVLILSNSLMTLIHQHFL
jgi:hypothetical protein